MAGKSSRMWPLLPFPRLSLSVCCPSAPQHTPALPGFSYNTSNFSFLLWGLVFWYLLIFSLGNFLNFQTYRKVIRIIKWIPVYQLAKCIDCHILPHLFFILSLHFICMCLLLKSFERDIMHLYSWILACFCPKNKDILFQNAINQNQDI